MTRQLISSGSPYEPRIGFARAVRVGRHVFVSGTAPIAADGSAAAPGDPAGQARRCFEIIQAALQEAGASLAHVVRTRVFLRRIEDWEEVGRVHGEFFAEVRPASTVVEVSRFIDPEWLVEVEAEALIDAEGHDDV